MSLKMPKTGVGVRFSAATSPPRTISPVSRPPSVLALKTPPLAQEEEVSSEEDEFSQVNGVNHCSIGKDGVGVGSESINEGRGSREGYLEKLTSFGRSHRRYFKLKGNKLYYAKNDKAQIFEEIDLCHCTVAESSSKLSLHCFQVITPSRTFVFGCEKRADLEEWTSAIVMAAAGNTNPDTQTEEGMEEGPRPPGAHTWYASSHAKPTYCNVCRDQLCVSFPGVTSRGLSCEVCKFKVHKRCAPRAPQNCKWTTVDTMGDDWVRDAYTGRRVMPHQWVEGNLPMAAKCLICHKGCGSLIRLQDWRCMWCKTTVHNGCKPPRETRCPVGHMSIVPPIVLHTLRDEGWSWSRESGDPDCSPLLVFINSRSGDHMGLKFLTRFRQLLNPDQVFDLAKGGPRRGLARYRRFNPFRILVCGGDGSVGWVMTEIDRLDIHDQCQVGVLPLGTGNDLARVLGWGPNCDDPSSLYRLMAKYESATTKMLDRWSVMTWERQVPTRDDAIAQAPKGPFEGEDGDNANRDREHDIPGEEFKGYEIYDEMTAEDEDDVCEGGPPDPEETEAVVLSQLENIMTSNEPTIIIVSTKLLCRIVGDMIERQNGRISDRQLHDKCLTLAAELKSVLDILREEMATATAPGGRVATMTTLSPPPATEGHGQGQRQRQRHSLALAFPFRRREELEERVEHLKLAVRALVEHVEAEEATAALSASSPPPASASASSSPVGRGTMSYRANANGCTLPVPHPYFICPGQDMSVTMSGRKLSNASSNASSIPEGIEIEDEEADPIYAPHWPPPGHGHVLGHRHGVGPPPPTIEIDSPSSSSPVKHCDNSGDEGDFDTATDVDVSIGMDYGLGSSSPSSSPLPGPSSSAQLLDPFPRGVSPRASRRVSLGSLFKSASASVSESTSSDPKAPKIAKTLPIINTSICPDESMVAKLLLANADTVCAVASPLMDPEGRGGGGELDGFHEKCVMNNYFGIGIDAKITLDFHMKREEHPEKCRSRARNFVWYGVLGGKEFLAKSCKNLHKRVRLECDGENINLPQLQGIVVLNIQSFMGGTNFWGGTKEDNTFVAPSFDDRVVEVVAVFDTMQMAASRLLSLQSHRISQCQSITITILGDEPVPVQVDGEAWLQAPGIVKIVHKNRMQVLCRNRVLEKKLKLWRKSKKGRKAKAKAKEKEKASPSPKAPGKSRKDSLVDFFKGRLSNSNSPAPPKNPKPPKTQKNPKNQDPEPNRDDDGKPSPSPAAEEEEEEKPKKKRSMFNLRFLRRRGKSGRKSDSESELEWERERDREPEQESERTSDGASSEPKPVATWSKRDVCDWLEHLQLGQHKRNFKARGISGAELINLQRRDLLALGVTRLVHVLQILQTVEGLRRDSGLGLRDDVTADIRALSDAEARGQEEAFVVGKQTSC